MMLSVWLNEPYRPTRDIDMLGLRPLDAAELKRVFATILAINANDAIVFDLDSIAIDTIREGTDHGGLRLRFIGFLGKGRLHLTIDIGLGDAVVPPAETRSLPVLLDFPAPTLLVYPPETAIAEKFEAIVKLGATNSRIKDYSDIWMMRGHCNPDMLSEAIAATFNRRKTPIPTELPNGLRPEYANDAARVSQWQRESQTLSQRPSSFELLIAEVSDFIMPHAHAARLLSHRT
jgi:hypothetical protein